WRLDLSMAGPFPSAFIKSPAPHSRSDRDRSILRFIASSDEGGSNRAGAHRIQSPRQVLRAHRSRTRPAANADHRLAQAGSRDWSGARNGLTGTVMLS